MNWARVKSILIVVFLIVNVFLMYKISEKYSVIELRADELADLKSLLSSNGIKLETNIPSRIKSLPRMKISNQMIDEYIVADKILGHGKWNLQQGSKTVYIAGIKQLQFEKQGVATLSVDIGREKALAITDEEKATKAVNDIIRGYIATEKYSKDTYFSDKTGITLTYKYEENGSEIFNNYLIARIIPEGKIVITHGMVNFQGFSTKRKNVTPVDALVELVRNLKSERNVVIKEIAIGYYVDLNKGNEIIKSGEADPAWKIKTNKGIFIFDGYTGNLLTKFGV